MRGSIRPQAAALKYGGAMGGFGTGVSSAAGAPGNADLVLRSPVRGFSIPRAAFEETFFVRMYDGEYAAALLAFFKRNS